MRTFKLNHLSDRELLRDLASLDKAGFETTASRLAHLAEVDKRRLFAEAGYSSMFAYCVRGRHWSEDVAYKRIKAARTAREFPELFAAVAAGCLHLSAVVILAPHLTPANAGELIVAVTHKSRSEIELFLARRFPQPDVKPMVRALPKRSESPVPGRVANSASIVDVAEHGGSADATSSLALSSVRAADPSPVPGRVNMPARPTQVRPLAPKRFAIQATIDQSTLDQLRHAQALLSHKLPSGDIAQVLGLALEALVEKLEKRKFAATERPRRARQATARRTIPARVKRSIWRRDQGQCTFIGKNGHRCSARKFLEFDHIDPVARGGEATVTGMRLRCRTHNQYEAERVFGAGFMNEKREAARRGRQRGRAAAVDPDRVVRACADAQILS